MAHDSKTEENDLAAWTTGLFGPIHKKHLTLRQVRSKFLYGVLLSLSY